MESRSKNELMDGNCDRVILHKFLPPQSEAFEHYDLRQRKHNFSLPARTSHLADNNFIQRMLYHDVYWWIYFY